MEREQIRRLFEQYYARMQRVARSLLYDEQEAEDVVGDVFESLLGGTAVLLPGTEEQYLMASVRNRCLKRLRHQRVVRQAQMPAPPDEDKTEDERLADIMEFVAARLSVQEQRILHLRFTGGYSYQEIALREGISRVAVWKHLAHAIAAIKKQFNPQKL